MVSGGPEAVKGLVLNNRWPDFDKATKKMAREVHVSGPEGTARCDLNC